MLFENSFLFYFFSFIFGAFYFWCFLFLVLYVFENKCKNKVTSRHNIQTEINAKNKITTRHNIKTEINAKKVTSRHNIQTEIIIKSKLNAQNIDIQQHRIFGYGISLHYGIWALLRHEKIPETQDLATLLTGNAWLSIGKRISCIS